MIFEIFLLDMEMNLSQGMFIISPPLIYFLVSPLHRLISKQSKLYQTKPNQTIPYQTKPNHTKQNKTMPLAWCVLVKLGQAHQIKEKKTKQDHTKHDKTKQ